MGMRNQLRQLEAPQQQAGADAERRAYEAPDEADRESLEEGLLQSASAHG